MGRFTAYFVHNYFLRMEYRANLVPEILYRGHRVKGGEKASSEEYEYREQGEHRKNLFSDFITYPDYITYVFNRVFLYKIFGCHYGDNHSLCRDYSPHISHNSDHFLQAYLSI